MGRWDPGAEERLRAAALELFLERGYEQTTVADIAQHAGLTSRTFFRYFTDKREVLFNGAGRLQQLMVDAIASCPLDTSPLAAVITALDATSSFFDGMREMACRRQRVISAHAELRERELIKLAHLADELAAALRQRGVAQTEARIAAEAGMAVFRVGFEQWVGNAERRSLQTILHALLARLQSVVGQGSGEIGAGRPQAGRGAGVEGASPLST